MSKSSFFESNNPFFVTFVRSFENTLCDGMSPIRHTREAGIQIREEGENLDSR